MSEGGRERGREGVMEGGGWRDIWREGGTGRREGGGGGGRKGVSE